MIEVVKHPNYSKEEFMYLMIIAYYPNDKADEVIKKYLETMEKFPNDESIGKEILSASGRGTKDGVEVFTILDIKKGKMDEAILRATKLMHEFRSIQGYRYEFKTLANTEEALEIYGFGS